MGLAAILLVGMAAALRMSISGADTGADSNTRAVAAQGAIEQLRSELNTSTLITSLTPASIAFTIPDRDADGQPESVEYTWPGTPGSGITRTFNGSSTLWIPDVRTLSVTEVVRSAPVVTESAETSLAACDFVLSSTLVEAPVNSIENAAVFFRIPPSDGAQSWKLTRFRVSLRRETTLTTPASVNAALFVADASGRPSGAAIASRSITINAGVSNLVPAYLEFAFDAAGLSPSTGYCVALSSPNSAAVRATMRTSGGAFNTHLLRSSNAGAAWSTPNDTDEMRFQVFGTLSALREVD